jgi:hypothetical protein
MDNTYYESILYRIIQGRLRLPFGDPVLYLYEPSNEIIEESFDIYKETYDDAYFKGVYIKDELKEILFYNDMWSPEDDNKAKEAEENLENLKVRAYENYYKPSELRGIKVNIKLTESIYRKHKSKIHSLDHISCEGVAAFARNIWIISKTVKDKSLNSISPDKLPLTKILEYYNSKSIDVSDMRYIARNDPFRTMWSSGKKQSSVFGKPSIELTKDQLSLCQFSSMYDNVYESHESPDEDVVKDDDCLDGWFIVQRREYDRSKNKRQMEKLLGNSKIANSDEIFIMSNDVHTAKKVYDMNDNMGKSIINTRNRQIKEAGSLNFTELMDIRQDMATQAHQGAIQKIRGK